MQIVERNDIPVSRLPGRLIQSAVGKGATVESGRITVRERSRFALTLTSAAPDKSK